MKSTQQYLITNQFKNSLTWYESVIKSLPFSQYSQSAPIEQTEKKKRGTEEASQGCSKTKTG